MPEESSFNKKEEKPAGIFGGKPFLEPRDIRIFTSKAQSIKLEGFGERAYRSEQEGAAQRLEKYTKKYFGKDTINERNWGNVDKYKKETESLLGRLSNEVEKAKREGRYEEAKAIKRDLEIYKSWKRGN